MEHEHEMRRTALLTHEAFDSHTVRGMERPLLDDGVPLMRMAASALAHEALDMLSDGDDEDDEDREVVLLAGGGDNGGDGLYAAARLVQKGISATVVAVGRTLHDEAFAAFTHAGGKVLVLDPQSDIPGCSAGFDEQEAKDRLQTAVELACGADLIIDAMTGIGVNGALRGIAAQMATLLRRIRTDGECDLTDDGDPSPLLPPVIAVDVPSGVGIDDGCLPGAYIQADRTVTFGALKPCLMLPPAAYECGRTILVDFGFDIDDVEPDVQAANDELAADAIRLAEVTDSKYSRGVVGLITGSTRYPGAAVLSSRSASRANVGMIRYIGPDIARRMVLSAVPEAVLGKGHVQSWVVGSGVPELDPVQGLRDSDTAPSPDTTATPASVAGSRSVGEAASPDDPNHAQMASISALLAHYAIDDADGGSPGPGSGPDGADADRMQADADAPAFAMPPLCVDAGALDVLPDRVVPQVVITPHAEELSRLLGRRGEEVNAARVLASPLHWATRAHELTGATVLLKGAITVVVGDDGVGGSRTVVCGSGPAWLATAGAGDVLAGLLGGLLAQQDGMLQQDASLVVDIAAAAAFLHGTAALIASDSDQRGWSEPEVYGAGSARKRGIDELHAVGHPIVASDVIDAIPTAIEDLLE